MPDYGIPTGNADFLTAPENNFYTNGKPMGGVANDYPVDRGSGIFVSLRTGEPWNGMAPNGNTYKNGMLTTLDPVTGKYLTPEEKTASDASLQNSDDRYTPVKVVTNPAGSERQVALQKQSQQIADSALKDFGDYLASFKTDLASVRQAGNAANDVAPFESALRKYQGDYSTSLDNASARYAASNADTTAQQNAIVQGRKDLLPSQVQSIQDAANAGLLALQQRQSRGEVAAGPMSAARNNSSDALNIAAQNASDVQIRANLEKIRMQNELTPLELGVSNAASARDTQYAGSFLPSIAGQQFSSGTWIEQTIFNAKKLAAEGKLQLAFQLMQAAQIPFDIQSRILSGEISMETALNQLYNSTNSIGIRDRLGVNVTPPVGYNMSLPNPPTYQPQRPNYFQPQGGGTSTGTGGVQPVGRLTNVGGGYARDEAGNTFTSSGQLVSSGGQRGSATATTRLQYMPQSETDRLAGLEDKYYEDQLRDDSYYNDPNWVQQYLP